MRTTKERKLQYVEHIMRGEKYETSRLIIKKKSKEKDVSDDAKTLC